MDIRHADPGGLRQRLSQVLAARPLLRGLLRALGAGGFCFVLAGAGLLDGPVPLALAPVCVLFLITMCFLGLRRTEATA